MTPRPVSPPRVTGRAARANARWAVLASLLAVAAVRIDWAGVASALGSAAPGLILVAAAATALRPPGDAGCRVGCGPSPWRRALRAVGRCWAAVHHSHRGLGLPGALAWVGLPALGQWVVAWLAIAAVLHALALGWVGLAGAGDLRRGPRGGGGPSRSP